MQSTTLTRKHFLRLNVLVHQIVLAQYADVYTNPERNTWMSMYVVHTSITKIDIWERWSD